MLTALIIWPLLSVIGCAFFHCLRRGADPHRLDDNDEWGG